MLLCFKKTYLWVSPPLVAQVVKHLPTMQETQVQSLGQEDPLEREMATHSSILAWKTPWTEKPGGLQSMGSPRVRHDWATSLSSHQQIPTKEWEWRNGLLAVSVAGGRLCGWLSQRSGREGCTVRPAWLLLTSSGQLSLPRHLKKKDRRATLFVSENTHWVQHPNAEWQVTRLVRTVLACQGLLEEYLILIQ